MLFEPSNIAINGDGKYSFNNSNFKVIENNFDESTLHNHFEYEDEFSIDLINYKINRQLLITWLFFDIKNKNNILINKNWI